MPDLDHIGDAMRAVRSSRLAISAAEHRRAAAVAAAQHLIDAARASERAEQDAARSALTAGLVRLSAAGLSVNRIAELCDIPRREIRQAAQPGLR
jgi:hypothetical protein